MYTKETGGVSFDKNYEYFRDNFREISVLSENDRCRTCVMHNADTNLFAVKKTLNLNAAAVYSTLKRIEDIHLAKIYGVFEDDGKCVVFEECIAGKPLYDLVLEKGMLDADTAAGYIMDLCRALKKIHAAGIVHRDIQPGNIIISADGVLKLIDFDISREMKPSAKKDTTVLGTAGYAAPEQFGFLQTDNRSDIYALGMLFRYMLTGDNEAWYDGRYADIIKKCTYIDPDKRYAAVDSLLSEIVSVNNKYENNSQYGKLGNEKIIGETWKSDDKKTFLNRVIRFIRTVPGYRSGNPVFVCLATLVYVFFLWCFGSMSVDAEWTWYKNAINIILWALVFLIPYLCIVNAGHFFDRMRLYSLIKSPVIKIIIRIFYAAFLFILLIIFGALASGI